MLAAHQALLIEGATHLCIEGVDLIRVRGQGLIQLGRRWGWLTPLFGRFGGLHLEVHTKGEDRGGWGGGVPAERGRG